MSRSSWRLGSLRLWPRGRLDLSWADLIFAALAVWWVRARTRPVWPDAPAHLAAFTVRTAWDALLATSGWPPGSEVIFSEANIPDMVRLIEAHDFVPVAAPLDPETLAVDAREVERLITPRTRALLMSPLFGSRIDLAAIGALARVHGLLLVEDNAQAFRGPEWHGSPEAAVALFSFGLIKTRTALGGAVIFVRDPALRATLEQRLRSYPRVSTRAFCAKWLRAVLLQGLTHPLLFGLLWRGLRAAGVEPDLWLSRATRGLRSGADLQAALRHQPHRATEYLLARRLHAQAGEAWRQERGRRSIALLPEALGRAAADSVFWALPICTTARTALQEQACEQGFDLSWRASSLVCHGKNPTPFSRAMETVIYLPIGTPMPESEWQRLLHLVRAADV